MQKAGIVVLLAVLALPAAVQGQVFKCVDDAGRTTYRDRACLDGSSQSTIGVAPNAPRSSLSQSEQWREDHRRAAELEAQRLHWRTASIEAPMASLMREMIAATLTLTLHDPSSLEIVNRGSFQTNGHGFRIDISYRATNLLGARVLTRERFYFDSNHIIERSQKL
ncbi:DUF4124 domain-containing protein [Vreelandella stevensii]|uniref:DUF4124 domain-containing protein n=1 Tax=Vreelandella stevensii TaxID=502821 RepID=UPI003747DAE7